MHSHASSHIYYIYRISLWPARIQFFKWRQFQKSVSMCSGELCVETERLQHDSAFFLFFCFKSHLSLISPAVFPTRLSRQNVPSFSSGSGLIGHFIDVPKLAAKWQDLHQNQHLKSWHEKRMIQQNLYALNHLRICHKACFLDMLKVTWWRETE